jgi:hypothetical protein
MPSASCSSPRSLEAGEKLADINARYPDVPLNAALRTFSFPKGATSPATDAYIDLALFHGAFCADVPADRAHVMALTQRPVSLDAFTTVITGTPAWKNLPSWAVVATSDHAIHPDAERDMAKRGVPRPSRSTDHTRLRIAAGGRGRDSPRSRHRLSDSPTRRTARTSLGVRSTRSATSRMTRRHAPAETIRRVVDEAVLAEQTGVDSSNR